MWLSYRILRRRYCNGKVSYPAVVHKNCPTVPSLEKILFERRICV